MPYRIDVAHPPADALDTLIALGALDVEPVADGLAAIMPETVPAAAVASALRVLDVRVSEVVGRDDASVWTLTLRPVRVRSLIIVPSSWPPLPDALRMADGPAFGTGLHPTTALCLEAIEDLLDVEIPERMLDVGTGSGILALAALRRGVPWTVGLDTDRDALTVAAENVRLNNRATRVALVRGTLAAIRGAWPFVVANIRAAELMAMARPMVRRLANRGTLVLSGIPRAVADEVQGTYRRCGMTAASRLERDGWVALVLRASW